MPLGTPHPEVVDPTPSDEAACEDQAQRRRACRVLVVEDESPIRDMLAELLRGAGYSVVQAADGYEALQIVRDHLPDLVILDLMLPRMSGWEFLEQSRRELDRGNIPVLIVSAIAGEGENPTGLGVAGWLTKPLDLDGFLAAVESLAGPAHRMLRQPLARRAERIARLLVVEDDVSIRRVLVEFFGDEGYVVDEAASISEARERIALTQPDLLVLDLMLAGESGWDFLRERRNDPALASIRVLVLSAAPKDLLMQASNLGADAFLSKPFDLGVLDAMIQSFVTWPVGGKTSRAGQ